MSTDPGLFALNPAAQLRVETMSSGVQVLIIDDFYRDPFAVRAAALGGRFDASMAYYPGMHSQIDGASTRELFGTLTSILGLLGDIRVQQEYFRTDFSIVTTPASEMLAKQKHPHIDPTPLAGLVYLNHDFEIGTSFFHHRPTGLAVLSAEDEVEAFYVWMDEFGEQHQPATYAVGDDHVWERIYTVQGKFNRLVMYAGNAFHSIDMRDVAANPTLDTARLTQRLFLGRVDNPVSST